MDDTHSKSLNQKKDSLKEEPLYAQFLGERYAHILIVGIILLYVIFKRRLHELKFMSWLFTGFSIILLILLGVELS